MRRAGRIAMRLLAGCLLAGAFLFSAWMLLPSLLGASIIPMIVLYVFGIIAVTTGVDKLGR